MIVLAAENGETVAFLIVGVLGVAIGAATYFVPTLFDGATRMRLRSQGLPDDDEVALKKDRDRRRFIAMIMGVVSAAILVQALTRL
jgi:hypothetical protein